jgi:hypothetical protein
VRCVEASRTSTVAQRRFFSFSSASKGLNNIAVARTAPLRRVHLGGPVQFVGSKDLPITALVAPSQWRLPQHMYSTQFGIGKILRSCS